MQQPTADAAPSPSDTLPGSIFLVGMMGAGKTSLGRRLAARLEVPFRDADHEIEVAAGLSVSEIFEKYGEPYFRDGERRVIARLLSEPPHIMATGGGAYMDPETRAAMKTGALTIWLKAPVEFLVARVKKRDTRPLLRGGDVREKIEKLLQTREPVYAEADITLNCDTDSQANAVEMIVDALTQRGFVA
jgi:shikimate kinase